MGTLSYGSSGLEVVFDDRTLAHLQLVIGVKLRRNESFFFSWQDSISVGDGRSAIWLDNAIPLYFRYRKSKPIPLSREWLELLTFSANSPGGLEFTPEPGRPTELPESHVSKA